MDKDIKELFHSLYDSRYYIGELMQIIDEHPEDIPEENIAIALEAAEKINANIYVISKLLGKKSPKFNFDQFKK